MLKFHFDTSVPFHPQIARILRSFGIDVTLPNEVGLREATDQEHLDYAHLTGRVVITNDEDFLAIDSRNQPHSGIVYFEQNTRSFNEVLEYLRLMHECYGLEDMRLLRVEWIPPLVESITQDSPETQQQLDSPENLIIAQHRRPARRIQLSDDT